MLSGIKTALQLAGAAATAIAGATALSSGANIQWLLAWIGMGVGAGIVVNVSLVLAIKVLYALPYLHVRNAYVSRDTAYLAGVFVSPLIIAVVLFLCRHEMSSNRVSGETRILAWEGGIFVVAALVVAHRLYRDQCAKRHKSCPECASTVPARARLCRDCWFRFTDDWLDRGL